MHVERFGLERWFAEHEHGADIMLAESGIRSLPADRFDTDPGELDYVIPTDGDPSFRETVAERYGRSADEVVFTCGAQEANFLAAVSLVDADDHAVVVTPTYQSLYALPASFGSVTQVSLSPPTWDLDVDAVADAVRPETTVVVLNEPNNPTGRYHDEATLRAVYDVAADADAHLLCDEVYRSLAEDPLSPAASLGPRGVSTSSPSKAHGLAGLRFGWLVGEERVVERARRWKDYTTISPPLFGQHVARQVLEDEAREAAILSENRALAATNRELVAAFVDEFDLDWHEPVGVNGFVTVPEGFESGETFCRAVVESESVVLAPGDLFGFPDRFRIGFGTSTETLREGLARVRRVAERRAE